MHTTVIPIKELSQKMQEKWREIQAANINLSGPCFAPELFLAVGKYLPNVYVAILSENNKVLGFLPFFKEKNKLLSIAKPIFLCDYQIIIGPASYKWDVKAILKGAGLDAWDFKHLVDFESLNSKEEWFEINNSYRVDLTNGFEKYISFLRHKNISLKHLAKSRKFLERDMGKIRFIPICTNKKILHQILIWKWHRYNSGRSIPPWIIKTLNNLNNYQKGSFLGILSALYAGNKLLAANIGIHYQSVFYYLLPSFNPKFSKYSPGKLLLYHLISELDSFHCKIFDFGPGEEEYKSQLSNSSITCMRGSYEVDSPLITLRRFKRTIKAKIKSIKYFDQIIQRNK